MTPLGRGGGSNLASTWDVSGWPSGTRPAKASSSSAFAQEARRGDRVQADARRHRRHRHRGDSPRLRSGGRRTDTRPDHQTGASLPAVRVSPRQTRRRRRAPPGDGPEPPTPGVARSGGASPSRIAAPRRVPSAESAHSSRRPSPCSIGLCPAEPAEATRRYSQRGDTGHRAKPLSSHLLFKRWRSSLARYWISSRPRPSDPALFLAVSTRPRRSSRYWIERSPRRCSARSVVSPRSRRAIKSCRNVPDIESSSARLSWPKRGPGSLLTGIWRTRSPRASGTSPRSTSMGVSAARQERWTGLR